MKKTITFITAIVTTILSVYSQCPSGNVILNTQAQVNQFIVDYPNCTVINGNVTISGADIVNLNGLGNLVEVTGYLGVYSNNLLQNFTGLENLTTLGASLDVSDNPGLLNASGLSGLTNIGTEIQFFNNALLQNISSLSGITGTAGGIWIIQNPQLQSLNGLQNIIQIGADIDIRENATLNNITALQSINSSSITPSGGYGLTIINNPAVSVCSLQNFCAYLANPASTHPRDIAGNLGNCATEQALVAVCSAPASGCLQSSLSQWPATTFIPSCTGTAEVIANDAWTGEYSKVQLTAGKEYTFSSSVPTDFITISNEAGTTAYMFGISSVMGIATSNETVRFYLHLDSLCNSGDNVNRSRIVQCSNGNVSISEIDADKLSYYPNPVTDMLNITYSQTITDVSVVNIIGKMLMSKVVNSNTAQIDMTLLPAGNYFIRVTLGEVIKTVKVLKN